MNTETEGPVFARHRLIKSLYERLKQSGSLMDRPCHAAAPLRAY